MTNDKSDRAVSRRTVIRATGVATGAGVLGITSAATGAERSEYDNYDYLGHGPAPGAEELVVEGDFAYVATGGAITTISLEDPSSPTPTSHVAGHHRGDTADVKADQDSGFAGLTHNSGQGGVSFFDISEDPANPEYLGFYPAASHVHNHFIEGEYAYLTIIDSFADSRMVILDLSAFREDEEPSPEAVSLESEGGYWQLKEVRKDMANAGVNPVHDIYVQDGLAYLCYWEAGIVVVDVSGEPGSGPGSKTDPVAVAHFGAIDAADSEDVGNREYVTGAKSNAHYVQPTPSGDYTFVGAETFPGPSLPPGSDTGEHPLGEHGGIRVFNTENVSTLDESAPGQSGDPGRGADHGRVGGDESGGAIYPSADDEPQILMPKGQPIADNDSRAEMDEDGDGHIAPDEWRYDAYIPAPEQPDDAALTSHNFDVTETKLFTSFYQGGIRAFDIADRTQPKELASFAPDGTAFWTAENLPTEEDLYYTVGSDIGKGAVVLELNDGGVL